MKVLMIVHIGETLGHLVRALAVADQVAAAGVLVEIACSSAGDWLFDSWSTSYPHHSVTWEFSHNSCEYLSPPVSTIAHVLQANRDILRVLREVQPDLVVGFPGILSVQAAQALRIPHVSVLHGPYLSPIVALESPTPTEEAVLGFARELFIDGPLDLVYEQLHYEMKLPSLSYREFLESQTILVPQDGLTLDKEHRNITSVDYISASFGAPLEVTDDVLRQACYVTFGTGNTCNVDAVVAACSRHFEKVIVSSGILASIRGGENVVVVKSVSSRSLARKVAAVVSHGGIGTVGTFAEFGTPQLVIPTELDQATMAVHGVRAQLCSQCGLDEWAANPQLGRRFPAISDHDLNASIERLALKGRSSDRHRCDGASQMAECICRLLDRRPVDR